MSLIKDLPQDIDDDLINELYTYAKQAVKKYRSMIIKANVDKEDIVQDVVLRALRYYPKFRGDCKLRSWVFLIARSHLVNCTNRRRFDQNAEITTSLYDTFTFDDGGSVGSYEEYLASENLEDELIREEAMLILEKVEYMSDSGSIPLNVLAESVLKGDSFKDIAKEHGVPVDEVKHLFNQVLEHIGEIHNA
ncbi:putative RNA polymerase sigma 70 factor protein [Nitrincola phage 1M3-16]|uniref:RNA polymerase sigma factor n=1 Tax=Nitrincola phage 1M3-16 TaxID=1472912 RepID=UPI000444CA20|nr:RNA polymerase sigma factor [Nitrincola phage 1M3-16]AHX01066.1 putative RNA polymerase sigma 70 factor protein [Nitrincola phage 1M3-16]